MDERGGVSIEITIGSVCPRTRKENAASRQRKSYRFNGEKRMKGNESSDSFAGGACAVLTSQRITFASAIKRLRSGKEAQRATGVQEHENRVQLSPEKGYLNGNETEI